MYIKKIEVNNYRQLKQVSINLEEAMNIVAGPNNSGKTSLIQLIKRIITDKDIKIKSNDINVYDQNVWSDKVKNLFKNNAKGNYVKSFVDNLDELKLPEVQVKFEIDYDEKDDISNIAEYLMDLDTERHSFYFVFRASLEKKMIKELEDNQPRLESRLGDALKEDGAGSAKLSNVISELMTIYCRNLKEHIYFTDQNYENENEITDISKFRKLFNFKYIPAARPVKDGDIDSHELSRELMSLVEKDENWVTEIGQLSGNLMSNLEQSHVSEILQEGSSQALNTVLKSISETNGGHTGELIFDSDVSQEDVQGLLGNTTHAKYKVQGESTGNTYYMNEGSQGLGYSNLIYLHSEIQKFIKLEDHQKINFLVIEEPESHMHPQMQYVFARELIRIYDAQKIQGLITTHSTELVRGTDMNSLRVIREESEFNSTVYDLSRFVRKEGHDGHGSEDESVRNFKDFFQTIGIADLLFADAALLFEGDTERLYLKHIINYDDDYKALRNRYIAYIQVGGAYAHKYAKIIKFLKIRTLVLTDIDYEKSVSNELEWKGSPTSNSAITGFYADDKGSESSPKISELIDWITEHDHIVQKVSLRKLDSLEPVEMDLICLRFQEKEDKYTRTLEAAMLAKIFSLDPFSKLADGTWKKYRKEKGLKYSIPRSDGGISLIDILNATSSGKTNFMFSVLLSNNAEKMLPNYIREGLNWLMER